MAILGGDWTLTTTRALFLVVSLFQAQPVQGPPGAPWRATHTGSPWLYLPADLSWPFLPSHREAGLGPAGQARKRTQVPRAV